MNRWLTIILRRRKSQSQEDLLLVEKHGYIADVAPQKYTIKESLHITQLIVMILV